MFKKMFIVILSSLSLFTFTICIIRMSKGLDPSFSLRTLSNAFSEYNSPHLVEHLLTTTYDNFLDCPASDGSGGSFSCGSSFGGGGGGGRSRGPYSDTLYWNEIKRGLDWSDFITVPFAFIIDMSYNVYFVIKSLNVLCNL